ncbi:MAG: tetratricopeptide repeat protein [Gemmatimonadota bacterium]|jgi:tetratricopeptide (TPR) repeat protein
MAAIEGSLADVSLADICQLISLGRKSGCLTVTDRSNFGYLYFEDGRVVYAFVLNRPDRLGELLVKNGAIEPEDLEKAMEEQGREDQKRLGEILLEMEALSAPVLEKWVETQVQEAVYHLLTWDQGTFHFEPDEFPDRNQVLLVALSTDGLLMEAARRVDEWSVIEKEVHSLDLVYKVTRDSQEVELDANQKKILPLLDGRRTVREVVEESGLVEFETGKAIFELVQAGFAKSVGERALNSEGEDKDLLQEHVRLGQAFYRAGMLEDAAKEFAKAVEKDPNQPTARVRLGLISLRNGDPKEALEHLGQLTPARAGQPDVLRNRALALELLGRDEEALEVLRESERVSGGDQEVILARGISEFKGGAPEESRATLFRYRDKVGRNTPPPFYYSFAVLASASSGYPEEAISLGREGLKAYPTETSILVNTGAILDYTGNHEAAEQYFIRAINSGSDVPPQAHKNLGDQAFRRGDIRTAQSHYEQAVKLNPSLGDDVFLKLGQIATEVGDVDLALLFLNRAIELNPDNEEARSRLAGLSPS